MLKMSGVKMSGGEGFIPYCVSCDGTVCYCKDKQQVIFSPSDEEYYKDLDEASRKHSGELDEDKRFRSSEDEGAKVVTDVGAEDEETKVLGGPVVVSLKHSTNLDGHMEFCSEDKEEEAAGAGVGVAVTEVGTEDNGAGEHVRVDSYSGPVNSDVGGSEVGDGDTGGPRPPDPPDTALESDNSQGGKLVLKPAQSAKPSVAGYGHKRTAGEASIPGQHVRALQTDLGGLACDTAATIPAVGAVQETIVKATVVGEDAVEEVTHSGDVKNALPISHRDLGSVVAKVFGTMEDGGVYSSLVDINSGGSEGEAKTGGPLADCYVPQDTKGMDEVGYSGLGSTEGEAISGGVLDGDAAEPVP